VFEFLDEEVNDFNNVEVSLLKKSIALIPFSLCKLLSGSTQIFIWPKPKTMKELTRTWEILQEQTNRELSIL